MTVPVGQQIVSVHARHAAATLFLLCILSFPAATPSSSDLAAPAAARPEIIFVQTSTLSAGIASQRFPEGSRIVRLGSAGNHSVPVNLTPDLFAAADPQVDFNGTKILFSGQKSRGDKWQIWEMDSSGSHQRQITQCAENCLCAGYLPGGEIVFTVLGRASESPESYLAVANLDGSSVHRITFSPGNWWFETVLRDGRVLASASWPLSSAASNPRLFYALRPDGAALDSLRNDPRPGILRGEAEELEDGSIVFVSRPSSRVQLGGELMEIPRGDLREKKIGAASGEYLSARRFSRNQLIVTRRQPEPASASQKLALYSFDLQKQLLGPLVYGDAHLSSIQPVALAARPVPKKFWSTLNPDSAVGYFISLDAYSSADAPNGLISTPIANVRVISREPNGNQERVLGIAPVEKDGSFYLEVPANQPVRFELLDASGQLIRGEKSWIWARPGEQRGCAGCHADKALAPENRWPMTLKRFDTPTHLDQYENASATKPK
jgi:Hydrazine synthase alpha subunit middle domain